jgi:hypothetical protein
VLHDVAGGFGSGDFELLCVLGGWLFWVCCARSLAFDSFDVLCGLPCPACLPCPAVIFYLCSGFPFCSIDTLAVDVPVPTLVVDVRVPTLVVDVRVPNLVVDVRVPTLVVDVRVPTFVVALLHFLGASLGTLVV